MSLLNCFCDHDYKYAGRVGDIHLYRCVKCGKEASKV